MYDADCLEKIGANVKFLRTMRKLRQQDVAQTLGISRATVYRRLGGKR